MPSFCVHEVFLAQNYNVKACYGFYIRSYLINDLFFAQILCIRCLIISSFILYAILAFIAYVSHVCYNILDI